MPTSAEILNGLIIAANKFIWIGIGWHIILFAFMVRLFTQKPVNTKIIASGMSVFLLSVGIISVLIHNPFNAIMFALAALIFGIYTLNFKAVPVRPEWSPATIVGLLMVIFGFVYPHFLEAKSWINYLYASPMGLIPCPTLSVFIGLTLMLRGFNSRKWMFTAAGLGLFYGIVGVLRLKVYLDVALIGGGSLLLVHAIIFKAKSS
jgi:hypothetical protein